MQYSTEKQIQMLIYLMKQHNVKKVIVSPGMKNIPFVASVQFDPFFEVYSCVDERSAAYMAYGMALESGEPVALSCTGATASRNYYSALTEAYYSNVPILAITSMSHIGEIGHLIPQILDRTEQPNDLVKYSTEIGPIKSKKDEWDVNVRLNNALLELRRCNGGPVHINLISENYTDFTNKLIKTRPIYRFSCEDSFPEIKASRVAIFVGAHTYFKSEQTILIDKFCEKYNGVVLCDNTSNYYGKYQVFPAAINTQEQDNKLLFNIDLLIHIGNISGAYIKLKPKKVWRVNRDGEIRDTFKKLEYVFEMSEEFFFKAYNEKKKKSISNMSYLSAWENKCKKVNLSEIDIPFSNAWVAREIENKLPNDSVLFLGILNTLRNWDFFSAPNGIECHANTGGFGIDGTLSTAIGAALTNTDRHHFVVLGDLGFFYDMNALGNRHLPSNLRVILINNGLGVEFRNYRHPAEKFGPDADAYMAAAGHFGKQSPDLVRHYAEDLGFEYLKASSKDEFQSIEPTILSTKLRMQPLLVEVFTRAEEENKALELISNVSHEINAKRIAKTFLGDVGSRKIKKLLDRN